MAKFAAIIIATVALFAGVQADACPGDAKLCGSEILNTYQCLDSISIITITPAGEDPNNCIYQTDKDGNPQGRGASCCAEGRCFPAGPGGQPDAKCD